MRRLLPIFVGLLVLVAVTPAQAAFPGKNGKIAYSHFVCDQRGCTENIFTVNEDGTGRIQLTSSGQNRSPAWSADGTKIGFNSSRAPAGIWTMNADGSGQQPLTEGSGAAWSPDGSKIAFTSFQSPSGIYVINADGSDRRLLVADVRDPAWSPDGTKIAYTGPGEDPEGQLGFAGDIYVMDADGTNQRRITQNGDIEYPCGADYFTYAESDSGPNWSPDGTKLVYSEEFNDLCGDGFAAFAVETVDASGTGPEHTIFSSFEGCIPPSAAWSPDGSRIAFTYCYLYGVDPDGSGRTPIDATCCGADGADWQPIVNHPPDCSGVAADPALLWPPNRRFRVVQLTGASDTDGDQVTLEITGVTQDEPVRGGRDAFGAADDLVRLRAEREPRGDGRVYQVAFTATDSKGADCQDTAEVTVPRHRKKVAVDSAPPSYDSLAG